MIDAHIKLPCGAELIAAQADDKSYLLLHLIPDRPLDNFVKIDSVKNKITVAIDPDNLEALSELIQKARPLTKFQRILKILREQ